MVTIQDSNEQGSYNSKLYEIEARLKVLEKSLESKADTKDVIVKIDELIKEKELITKSELNNFHKKMEATLNANHVKLLKWIIATGISTVAAVAGVLRLFI
ncbi:hypothetical protein [Lentibacillus amyloliquefaciens]|uniref:Uncharacterized protein n=1 Tax=Lentibacillus amyloliquefaciens TaxID=1472767 RepID=A0A0U4F488_9BACI|nr:hypothetical protein [Lentibacillus amyloliquefaciens]ALX50327.1 hypothetical protein AOX59_18130 [Lentibacillus amyloliquefaciens]